ncbi:hypothetical protein DN614_25360 [Klebsiella michiganensis]|nr:hypothetical protein [Klebsiella michiganensis]RWS80657.1 hypothetical protein DN614_25360 [Klebsiella michiganensis]RXI20738.1 hypothetical protein DOD04_00880 [Klebsiella michiganensis]
MPLCWLLSLTTVTYLSKLLGFIQLPPRSTLNDFVYKLGASTLKECKNDRTEERSLPARAATPAG